MDDYEFARSFQEELERYLRETSDADFCLNPPQALAFASLVNQIQNLANQFGGSIEPIELVPRIGCGSVTASFPLLDLCGIDLWRFSGILQYASAFSIEALDDGSVCVSLNIPNVFVAKDGNI